MRITRIAERFRVDNTHFTWYNHFWLTTTPPLVRQRLFCSSIVVVHRPSTVFCKFVSLSENQITSVTRSLCRLQWQTFPIIGEHLSASPPLSTIPIAISLPRLHHSLFSLRFIFPFLNTHRQQSTYKQVRKTN